MKNHIIFILAFCALFLGANAQETIIIDGKEIELSQLNPYRPYQVDDAQLNNETKLKSAGVKKEKKVVDQKVYGSKDRKRFAQYTLWGDENSEENLTPSASFKFFDEKGKLKWEKKLDKEGQEYSYLSDDGKYWIVKMGRFNEETSKEMKSLVIFKENGEEAFRVDSILEIRVSASRDLVCYQKDTNHTNRNGNIFYCYDIKNKKLWSKSFNSKVFPRPASLNGDYIIAYYDGKYNLYDRAGKELFQKPVSDFGGGISSISYDGKYALANRSSAIDTSYILIFDIGKMESSRTNYYKTPEISSIIGRGYNGAAFIRNSHYLLALTSIIAPYTAIIVFHNLRGEYLGHKVYYEILSSFSGPDITLLEDGSFEIYVDGYYLGNLVLPGVNTMKYLKK